MRKIKYLLYGLLISAPLLAYGYGEWIRPALAQCPGVNCTAAVVVNTPIDGARQSYAATTGLTFAPAASPTDISQICGSATKTVRITKVIFTGRATAVAAVDVTVVKRSTADTGATGNITPTPLDANNAAASALPTNFTTNPVTLGTLVSSVATQQFVYSNLTTGLGGPPAVFEFGRVAQSLVLRGAAQCAAINLGNQTNSGNTVNVSWEWTEDNS